MRKIIKFLLLKLKRSVNHQIRKTDTLYNLKRIMPFVKPYWRRTVIALALAVPIGCLDAVIALSLKPYMDIVMIEKNVQSPWYIPILIVAFTSLQGILNYASTYYNDWVTGKVSNDVKRALYNKLMYKSSTFFDKKTSGDIQKKFNKDAQTACGGLLGNIKMIISRVCSSLSLIAVLIYNSWQLAIIAIFILILAIIPAARTKKILKSAVNKSEGASSVVITDYNEVYSGSKIVKAFNLYKRQNGIFQQHLNTVFRTRMKITQRTAIISPIMHVIVSVGIALAIGFGSYLITTGQITSGNFVSFITALIMLYTPIKGLGGSAKSITGSLLALERVVKNMDAPDDIIDSDEAVDMKSFDKDIIFNKVSFAYKKNKPVLKDVSFTVKKGQTFALVGNSGGGKSTIVNLLPRFYPLKKGSILIDDVDIRDYKINSLRDNIAIVLQENFLFAGTIRENIMVGKLDATEEEINKAVENACLSEFIESLEEGLDTNIGERGVLLSGGQKQRIAIARAFLKDAPIVILDEATSSLDNQSEAVVQNAIDNLMKDKTVFVIAHRLSTVKNANKIAVIHEGQLVETGTHEELINIEKGYYKELYEMQFKKD